MTLKSASLATITCLLSLNTMIATMSNKELFNLIYKQNKWPDSESRSGKGSGLRETPIIRSILPDVLKKINAKSLLDAGCGDFFWMKELDLSCLDLYIGADIVADVIEQNNQKYGNTKRRFIELDITSDSIPQVDIVLCRDCLQHLSNEDIFKAINNLKKSKSTYLLASNAWTKNQNFNIPQDPKLALTWRVTGNGRNLQLPPFNFPKPLDIIIEGFEGKCLALWAIADLPDYRG